MAAYPGSLASFTGFTSSHTLAADSHASQHNLEQSEIVAVQTKVGTGSSTSTNNTVLRGNGIGTSTWGQANLTTDVTGALPIANGGTGQTTLNGLTLTNPNITGTVTGSATYTTPVIASFINATHNHQNAAGGGTLAAQAVPALDLSLQTLSNPYKFSVYRNAALAWASGAALIFDTKVFDTNNNFSTSTGQYTASVSGYYFFIAGVGFNISAQANTAFGFSFSTATLTYNNSYVNMYTGSYSAISVASALISLTAGDYVQIANNIAPNTQSINVGASSTYFQGFLISKT